MRANKVAVYRTEQDLLDGKPYDSFVQVPSRFGFLFLDSYIYENQLYYGHTDPQTKQVIILLDSPMIA